MLQSCFQYFFEIHHHNFLWLRTYVLLHVIFPQEAAFTVQNLYSSTDPSKAERLVEKSDALLAYLERQRASLKAPCGGATLAESLNNICWVRALSTRPPGYPGSVPWGGRQNGSGVFYRPSEVAGRAYASVCGSVMPVVAVEVSAG